MNVMHLLRPARGSARTRAITVGAGLGLCLLLGACSGAPREQPAGTREATRAPLASQAPQPAQASQAPQALTVAASSRPRAPRLSPEELLARLRTRLSQPAGELRVQRGPDGSRRVALMGHLQHATLAVRGADGRVVTACVDSPAAAARVLGVEPTELTP